MPLWGSDFAVREHAGEPEVAARIRRLVNYIKEVCSDEIVEHFADVSLLVRYGENSGDSTHAEPHSGTPCHYQIFF
jgi:hypothetical protein